MAEIKVKSVAKDFGIDAKVFAELIVETNPGAKVGEEVDTALLNILLNKLTESAKSVSMDKYT